ncbi:MarR family winged helix-turn-helix transcriptional regulator [Clostridium sp. CF012]|uniref:MarR family winged helix-turn-helix transcriptional regulator n=1 Tax=Clostridium sp. CF012 TaxID=2843319 RepID=UPI001C0B70CF|nr:MarR family transcriptional regulator [Clostridium sp. CF012]MBU3143742.1 MarR family transcriptional regulator [Clostridium sp. CF012]
MFDIESCVCFINNKTAKKMANMFNERLIPLGVTRVQWIAMYYLLKNGDLSQKELGEKMDIKESTVARLLDRMEEEGLIIRTQVKEDRRVKYIKLTPKGRERIEELLPEGQKMSELFSLGITEDEIQVFKRVLEKFVENIS